MPTFDDKTRTELEAAAFRKLVAEEMPDGEPAA